MQPEYSTVVDPVTLIPTALAMGIHLAVAAGQVALAVFLVVSGCLSVRRGEGARGLAILRIVLGGLLVLPLVVGAPSMISLLACAGALAVLVFERRSAPDGPWPGRRSRWMAVITAAFVTVFLLWEREDPLALGVYLTTNLNDWRVQELDWQLSNDRSAPKVGDLAPDFELQDPSGETAVRLSNFRGERPVVLVFGSYT